MGDHPPHAHIAPPHRVIPRPAVDQLEALGAVGHICAQFYDADGRLVPSQVNARAITIGLAALKRVPSVVIVAGGAAKVRALRGALRGGYAEVLVTDEVAARGVLAGDETAR